MKRSGAEQRAIWAALLVGAALCGCFRAGPQMALVGPPPETLFSVEDMGASLGPYEPPATLDNDGNAIELPRGNASFADEVVEFRMGSPAPVVEGQTATAALGPPDYRGGSAARSPRAVTLGHRGSITLRFTDNALVDVDGPDLYVYEVGPDVESTVVEISDDGRKWINVGKIGGHTTSVDIGKSVAPAQVFYYVRLSDDGDQGNSLGEWPGADIDAVAAVGSAERIELSGEVLFEHDSDRLLVGAADALGKVLERIKARQRAAVTVLGHTDSRGSDEYNLDLSRRRAAAVGRYIEERGVAGGRLTIEAHGEARPVADNGTPEGRQKNRRVEVLIQDQ